MECADLVSGLVLLPEAKRVEADGSGYQLQLDAWSFGNATLDGYLRRLFREHYPVLGGAFPLQGLAHAALQQLATRSRVAPDEQGFLMLGGFDAEDLAAGLIHSMPQTRVIWAPLDGAPETAAVERAIARQRASLPPDGMSQNVICLKDADAVQQALGHTRCGVLVMATQKLLPPVKPLLSFLDIRCSVIRISGDAMPEPLGWPLRREAAFNTPTGCNLPPMLNIALDERAP